jgi:hypothetical protein
VNVLRNWFHFLSSARRSPVPRPGRHQDRRASLRLQLEQLESRTLLSVTAHFVGSQLIADGDGSGNTIRVDVVGSGDTALQRISYLAGGSYVEVGRYGGFSSFLINSGAGNDTVNINGIIYPDSPLTINGNNGFDVVNLNSAARDTTVHNTLGFTDLHITDPLGALNTTATVTRSSVTLAHPPFADGTYVINYTEADLSALAINLGNADNTVVVNGTPELDRGGLVTTVVGGAGVNIINVRATTGSLNVVGHSPNTTVSVGNNGSLGGIFGAVNVAGTPNSTDLTINDSADTFADRALTLSDTSVTISPITTISYSASAIRSLTLEGGPGSSGANTYHVFNTPAGQTTIRMRGGDDFMQIHGDQGPLAVGGFANNAVLVGNAGSLGGIRAPVSVANIGGLTAATLAVDDSADTFADRLVTLGVTSLTISGTPLTTINYSAITWLTYEGGPGSSGNNTYRVNGTPALAGVALNAHGSNDTLVGPTASTGWQITGSNAGQLTGNAFGGPFNFTGIKNLTGGSGNDAFVFADGARVDGNISDVGAANTLDYSAYSTPVTVDLSAGTATGVGGSVQNILTLRGGAGDDSLTGNATGYTIFVASPGNDTVTGLPSSSNFLYNADANGSADSTWSVTAQNSGTLTFFGAATAFSGVQNLAGAGTGADAFVFADGAGVDGSIQGSGQTLTNTLNYAAYSTTVVVDLQTHTGTGVGGQVLNIQNAMGGTGGAAGVYNILVGNGGNVLTGGNGRRNLLIAGASASTLIGGDSGDILIGGTTNYDMDVASLQAIAQYWAGTDDYDTRVANLTSGNGVPLLDASTVHTNGGGNTLQGGPGRNLFYGDLARDTYTWDPASETFVSV